MKAEVQLVKDFPIFFIIQALLLFWSFCAKSFQLIEGFSLFAGILWF